MPYAQNYMNASQNGVDVPLQAGSPTVGNIVNGYFERPLYKIKGVFPDWNENRSMPLRLWEIIEINWRDFSQYVGKLQGFGWEFDPQLHDDYNADKQKLDNLQVQLVSQQNQLAEEQKIHDQLNVRLTNTKSTLADLQKTHDVLLGMQDVGTDTLKEAEQLTQFTNDSSFPTTVIALKSKVASIQLEVDSSQAVITDLKAQITKTQQDIQTTQNTINTKYKDLNPDELGLTDAFMHAIYTEFLKRFWAYNIGVFNPELWFLQLNAFLGNQLPMLYKAARIVAESKDFSSRQWQEGGGSVTGTTVGNEHSSGEQFGDNTNKGHNQGIGAVANTPQSRLNLNARNIDFGNQVNNTEGSQQGVGSTATVSNNNQESSTTTSNISNNSGKQFQLDPLGTWYKVLATDGYFGNLWEKAWDYGLFDATTF